MAFQKDFLWGTATSSYQIEGGAFEDGRGLTVWEDFCSRKGKIFSGHNGDVACDHYHRFREDVELMSQMGIKAYRFSIAWSRILPKGFGEVNEKGLKFYSDLVDVLLEKGITPLVTLFHWDLPYALYERGGWQNPDSVRWFADYAGIVARCLGDRVKHFITFNEPQCFIGLGHVTGEHAPGNLMSRKAVLTMAHHVLMAHGSAVKEIRSAAGDAKIGYAPTSTVAMPFTDQPEDVDAARKAYFTLNPQDENYMWSVTWWSDPVLLGKYPEPEMERFEKDMPSAGTEDMKLISQPIDFYGQNIYNGYHVQADGRGGYEGTERKIGYPRTSNGWPVTPDCLYWGAKFLYERYKKPILITENGLACHDWVSADGKVHDPNRIDFMYRYLWELNRAAREGVPIMGYCAWSFMDNFEWAKGYFERFGLIYVDYESQKRIPKDSAYWYRDLINSGGELLDGPKPGDF